MSRQFSRETKRLVWNQSGGRCEYVRDGERCNAQLTPGNRIYDHIIAWEISHDSSFGNCQVICTRCDREKKTPADARRIAETRHKRDFHLGITGPGLGRSPMRGGRRSRERKTFRHGVVPRVTQQEAHRRMIAKRYPGRRQ